MKIRQGSKNKHNLYLQVGDEPNSERDIPLGFIKDPNFASAIVDLINANPERDFALDRADSAPEWGS